jgi:tetratricopeptide (TPR) repeat protein
LVVLFALWGNASPWFVVGLAVVTLIQIGQWLDGLTSGAAGSGGRALLRRLGDVAILTVVALANPAYLHGLSLPEELGWGAGGAIESSSRLAVTSPFERAYLSTLNGSPAALAYYALLGLSLTSFLLALPRWRWGWFLPWVGLAGLSVLQVRTVPFFAVVAGPVLAWNLQDVFARQSWPAAGRAVTFTLATVAAAFLVSAWPGWLQRPPYEPRRWAIQTPPELEQTALAVRKGYEEGLWQPGSRTLHLSRDTASTFAWFCPEDQGVMDERLTAVAAGADNSPASRDKAFSEAGIGRVVVRVADRGQPLTALTRLLGYSEHWPLLYLEGGVVTFGRRDPTQPDPFQGRELNLDRLGFRPTAEEKAPPAAVETRQRWWEALWKPAPVLTGDRDEATVLLLKAEMMRASAPQRHLATWQATQMAALIAAAPGWVGPEGVTEVGVRLMLIRPPIRPPDVAPAPIAQYVFTCRQVLDLTRDDAPLGTLYAAVRAARRAVSANPADAWSYLLLGQCYRRLLTNTRERAWALRLPQLAELRQAQASAALNRAIALNPGLAQAHLELGRLYQQIGYLDLALTHLRAHRDAGRGGTSAGPEAVSSAELADLSAYVDRQLAEFGPESVRARVADRARAAKERGLVGKARAILLESDLSAFGNAGMELELDLLLRTGRAEDVRDWTSSEFKESLGDASYHWMRTQALAAIGEYAAADVELTELTGKEGPDPTRTAGVFALLTGRALLDGRPCGQGMPADAWGAVVRFLFWSAMQEEIAALTRRADSSVLRGLIALEAGEMDRARLAFQAALAISAESPAGVGVRFNGEQVGRDGLALLR